MEHQQNKTEWQALLEKFWDGNTTEAEEEQLRHFFQYAEVPAEWEAYKLYFDALHSKPIAPGQSFDDAIMARISDEKNTGYRSFSLYRNLALAASLALLFTLGAYNIWKPTPVIQQLNTISENEAIVAAAFDQTREALFMLSSNMKKGEEQMIHLTKFNQAQQRINTEKP
jgi:hypothetical protein